MNKTLTLKNITIRGYSTSGYYSYATIQGKDGNLIVEKDATLIGSDSFSSNIGYKSGPAIKELKNVIIKGTVMSGGKGTDKIDGGAIHDCYKVIIEGGKVEGRNATEATPTYSAHEYLIDSVNYLEIKKGYLIGSNDPRKDGSGLIGNTFFAEIIDSQLKSSRMFGGNNQISISHSRMHHSYPRDSACGLKIENTNLIGYNANESLNDRMEDTDYDEGILPNDWSSTIVLDVSTNLDYMPQYDKEPAIINIGENVTITGSNTTVGNAATAISCEGNKQSVIVKIGKGAKIIGGHTTDSSAKTYGGYAIEGGSVEAENATIQGGQGFFGGYAIINAKNVELSKESTIVGGEGYQVGGHALFKVSTVTINSSNITGGKGASFTDEQHRGGAAIFETEILKINGGKLKPGQGGYTTCYIQDLYMIDGQICNSTGNIEASSSDLPKPAIQFYGSDNSRLQVSGGQIGYMFVDDKGQTIKKLAILGTMKPHWVYFKEDRDIPWNDQLAAGEGWRFYADEVICDGKNITGDQEILPSNNIYSSNAIANLTENKNILVYSKDTVSVTFDRPITSNDDIIISARNWDKEDAPYERLNIDIQYITDGSDGKISFQQPQRSIRVELRKKDTYAKEEKNQVQGLDLKYIIDDKISFNAVGDNMSQKTYGIHDTRFVPVSWKVNPHGEWNKPPYTATFTITKSGYYTLKVTFEEEQYFGHDIWLRTGDMDQKSISFVIDPKINIPDDSVQDDNFPDNSNDNLPNINVTPDISDQSQNSFDSTTQNVTTGDHTPTGIYIVTLSLLSLILIYQYKKHRK